jgi:hypothetical protein
MVETIQYRLIEHMTKPPITVNCAVPIKCAKDFFPAQWDSSMRPGERIFVTEDHIGYINVRIELQEEQIVIAELRAALILESLRQHLSVVVENNHSIKRHQ